MLADWRTAPIDARLRAMLGFLEKMTLRPTELGPPDAAAVRAAGVSDEQMKNAIHVTALFNMIDRIADALEFHIPDAAGFQAGARMLLKRGYA